MAIANNSFMNGDVRIRRRTSLPAAWTDDRERNLRIVSEF